MGNQDTLPALRRYKGVKRVDAEQKDTKVVIYFDSITRVEICPTIEAFRTYRVANQKPAPVLVYDVVPATVCDICEDDDCPDDGCPDRPQFPNFGSYAFREAYYDAGSGAGREAERGISLLLGLLILIPLL